MTGTIVNTIAIIVGGTLGLLLKTSIPDRYKTMFFQAVGLVSIGLGVSMVATMEHILCVIAAMVLGTWLGTWWNIEQGVERLGEWMKHKMRIGSERFSEGLVTSFLLFCVGSMTILGAVQEGMGISSDLLYTKSIMDGFSSIILASVFGVGVLFSSVPLFLFQGGLTLLAMWVGSFFSSDIIGELTATGGLMLIGMGINVLEIKKISIANMLPALILVCVFVWLSGFFN